jgi:hypothetical protein
MGAVNHDFGKNEREIFYAQGLDRGDVVEAADEISFSARAIGLRSCPVGRIAAGAAR